MKKEFKGIIAIIVAIWIFVMGFEIGILKGTNDTIEELGSPSAPIATDAPTAESTTETTTAATTAESTTAAPDVNADASTSATDPSVAPAPGAADPSTMTKEQITAKVVEYINKVKAEQNMTAVKTESITISVDSCSVASLTSTVNDVVQGIVGEPAPPHTFTFVNGQGTDADGNTVSAHDAIPPSNDSTKDAKLDPSGVASATAVKQGDNTVYTVILVAESTTISNGVPPHNSGVIGYLNLGAIEIPVPGISITEANMNYPNSTVEVTVNSADQVVKLVNKMPMNGSGTAKVTFANATASFSGGLDETWEFTY